MRFIHIFPRCSSGWSVSQPGTVASHKSQALLLILPALHSPAACLRPELLPHELPPALQGRGRQQGVLPAAPKGAQGIESEGSENSCTQTQRLTYFTPLLNSFCPRLDLCGLPAPRKGRARLQSDHRKWLEMEKNDHNINFSLTIILL